MKSGTTTAKNALFKGYSYDQVAVAPVDLARTTTTTTPWSKNPLFLGFIIISSTLIITCVVLIGRGAAPNDTKTPESAHSVPDSIHSVCNVTRYPDSCATSIEAEASKMNNTSLLTALFAGNVKEKVLFMSLEVNLKELTSLSRNSSITSGSRGSVKGKLAENALGDCKNLISDAMDQVNESVSRMKKNATTVKEKEAKMNDIRTWLSAAMSDEETCLDGLDEAEEGLLTAKVREEMKKSNEWLSISLAIAANIVEGKKPAHSRKLLVTF